MLCESLWHSTYGLGQCLWLSWDVICYGGRSRGEGALLYLCTIFVWFMFNSTGRRPVECVKRGWVLGHTTLHVQCLYWWNSLQITKPKSWIILQKTLYCTCSINVSDSLTVSASSLHLCFIDLICTKAWSMSRSLSTSGGAGAEAVCVCVCVCVCVRERESESVCVCVCGGGGGCQ